MLLFLPARHSGPVTESLACVTKSSLSHLPAIKYNDTPGPTSQFAVTMVTVGRFSSERFSEYNAGLISLFSAGTADSFLKL